MCGIIGYINFLSDKKRFEIIEILLNGLARLEYRGYDSAGRNFSLHLTIVLFPYIYLFIICPVVVVSLSLFLSFICAMLTC